MTPLFLVEDTKDCLKARHILGLLGFLGFANVYAMRVNLSVAIVAMVNSTVNPISSNTSTFDHCPVSNSTNTTEPAVSNYVMEYSVCALKIDVCLWPIRSLLNMCYLLFPQFLETRGV